MAQRGFPTRVGGNRGLDQLANFNEKLGSVIRLMQVMTGIYDTAARETAVINPAALFPEVPDAEPAAKPAARKRPTRQRS